MRDPMGRDAKAAADDTTVSGQTSKTVPVDGGDDVLDGLLETPADAEAAVARLAATVPRESAGGLTEAKHGLLLDTLHNADVYVGAYEHRILRELAYDDPHIVVALAGLIVRAHQAGVQRGQSAGS